MPVAIDISCEFSGWDRCSFPLEETVEKAVAAALAQSPFAETIGLRDSELSIVLCDDPFIQNLNREYRGKDKPTNVLSFPQTDFTDIQTLPDYLPFGDIILSFQTIVNEAQEQQKTMQNHFTHLVIHGMLHLMGYDHEMPDEASTMESLEIGALETLGIKNPYSDAGFVA